MRSLTYIALLLILMGTVSCKKCRTRMGDRTLREEALPSFRYVEVEGKFRVRLIQDSTCWIRLSGGEDLIANVDYTATSEKLKVVNTNNCSFLKNYKDDILLEIGIDTLLEMDMTVSGELISTNRLKQDMFKLQIHDMALYTDIVIDATVITVNVINSSGDIRISGKSRDLNLDTGGYGVFYGQELRTQRCFLNSIGTGDIIVNADSLLYATIAGSGNIYYSGNPRLEVEDDGDYPGTLIKQ